VKWVKADSQISKVEKYQLRVSLPNVRAVHEHLAPHPILCLFQSLSPLFPTPTSLSPMLFQTLKHTHSRHIPLTLLPIPSCSFPPAEPYLLTTHHSIPCACTDCDGTKSQSEDPFTWYRSTCCRSVDTAFPLYSLFCLYTPAYIAINKSENVCDA
jgi:hypothetical protein